MLCSSPCRLGRSRYSPLPQRPVVLESVSLLNQIPLHEHQCALQCVSLLTLSVLAILGLGVIESRSWIVGRDERTVGPGGGYGRGLSEARSKQQLQRDPIALEVPCGVRQADLLSTRNPVTLGPERAMTPLLPILCRHAVLKHHGRSASAHTPSRFLVLFTLSEQVIV